MQQQQTEKIYQNSRRDIERIPAHEIIKSSICSTGDSHDCSPVCGSFLSGDAADNLHPPTLCVGQQERPSAARQLTQPSPTSFYLLFYSHHGCFYSYKSQRRKSTTDQDVADYRGERGEGGGLCIYTYIAEEKTPSEEGEQCESRSAGGPGKQGGRLDFRAANERDRWQSVGEAA